jgi:hypothetical protein
MANGKWQWAKLERFKQNDSLKKAQKAQESAPLRLLVAMIQFTLR